jgi:hypothetical protein
LSVGTASTSAKQVFPLEGKIQDESGNYISGAQVELRQAAKNISIATISADNGSFRFLGIAAGEYQVVVRRAGFVTLFSPVFIPLSDHSHLKLSLIKERGQAHIGPEVIITEPFDMVPVGDTIKVSAKAVDPKGVLLIEIYIDGELEASANSDSISVFWDSAVVRNGTHVILAKAYNRVRQAGQSEETIVSVENP